jgi:hypothetical protein
MAGVRFPAGTGNFSLLHGVRTDRGANPASDPHFYSYLFSRVKQTEDEANHSPLSSAEVKNSGAKPPLSRTSPWHSA